MKALIDLRNNRICQIEQDLAVFEVAEDLTWVDCPETCTTTWIYDGTSFVEIDSNTNYGQFIGTNVNLTDAQLKAIIIEDRNKRLANCDWTQLPDIPSTVDKAAWAVYRQALRDLPNNNLDVHNPVYPVPPIV
jgi:hypothetical protein